MRWQGPFKQLLMAVPILKRLPNVIIPSQMCGIHYVANHNRGHSIFLVQSLVNILNGVFPLERKGLSFQFCVQSFWMLAFLILFKDYSLGLMEMIQK